MILEMTSSTSGKQLQQKKGADLTRSFSLFLYISISKEVEQNVTQMTFVMLYQ